MLDQSLFRDFVEVMEMYELQLAKAPLGVLQEGVALMEEFLTAGESAQSANRRGPIT